MADYKLISEKDRHRCLECGGKIPSSSRPDKKFCCPQCRNSYNNHRRVFRERYKNKVERILAGNYAVLENLLDKNITNLTVNEVVAMGFNCSFMTSCVKAGSVARYSCFDIMYRISDTKIWGIQRMSLNL